MNFQPNKLLGKWQKCLRVCFALKTNDFLVHFFKLNTYNKIWCNVHHLRDRKIIYFMFKQEYYPFTNYEYLKKKNGISIQPI